MTGELDVFRLLVKAGGEGQLAREIAATLGIRPNTLSASLTILHHAGLVTSRREGRGIRYFADMEGMRGLLGFLMEDCCGGAPEAVPTRARPSRLRLLRSARCLIR